MPFEVEDALILLLCTRKRLHFQAFSSRLRKLAALEQAQAGLQTRAMQCAKS